MACSVRVRSAIVKYGAVKAIALLSTIPDETIRGYCSDSLCELSDLPDSRSQMIEDGAAKALLKLCKSPSRATQYSCALALGSLAHAFGESHCCFVLLTVVAFIPAMPTSPDSLNA